MYSIHSRRQFLFSALSATACLEFSDAFGQVTDPRPPMVDPSNPVEVSPGVWVVRDRRVWLVPNIGIIVGKDAALVLDTGLGPDNGERVLELARKLAGKRKLYLSLTHFHPEHGYGAQVFEREATILYNRVQRDELIEKGVRYIELFKETQSKAAAEALQGTRIQLPHHVYEGPSTEIDLGGRTVQLLNWGTAHTRGDQVAFLPKERILFAGDLIEERMFPIFPWFPPTDIDVDAARWSNVLRGFQQLAPKLIVPGHGDSGSMAIALNLANQIDAVGTEIDKAMDQGLPAADVIGRYKSVLIAANPDWEHTGLIDWELNYFSSGRDRGAASRIGAH